MIDKNEKIFKLISYSKKKSDKIMSPLSKKPLHTSMMFCCILMGSFSLTGCGDLSSSALQSLTTFKASTVWLQKVSFKVSDQVNDSSPVTLHIVIPYTTDLYQSLSQMSATDYFSKVNQIKLDNAEKVDIFEWDLIRSQTLNDESIKPSKSSGVGILVFAHYSAPGDHRLTIGSEENVLITLNNTDFTVTAKTH
jgi:type VI secretion system protein